MVTFFSEKLLTEV